MSARNSTSPAKSSRRPTTRGSPSIVRQTQSASGVQPGENGPSSERVVDGAEATNREEHSVAVTNEEDPETAELARLRCSSIQTEVISERNRRTGQSSAGYPGLSFGNSVFGSNTMMKLRIISNELHNIMNVYLKRAEGEIVALNNRVQLLEADLGKSESGLKAATRSLEEAARTLDENESIDQEIENRDSVEDGSLALLDFQLNKAKELARETDKNYKEMALRISSNQIFQNQTAP